MPGAPAPVPIGMFFPDAHPAEAGRHRRAEVTLKLGRNDPGLFRNFKPGSRS
jgi:hypothetical protein